MIVDNLYSSHADYGLLNPKLARAFEWLKTNDVSEIEAGRSITVDGPRVTVQTQAYQTLKPEEARFEAHRAFIDIQLVVAGRETIYWAPLERLPEVAAAYDYEKDIVFFEEPRTSIALPLTAGDYAVFFPTDAHKPRCVVTQPESVRKIVVKVAV